jgi:hypothetical protein
MVMVAGPETIERARMGLPLTVDEAVRVTVALDLPGFKAFDVAFWPFQKAPLRLKKKYRRSPVEQREPWHAP